MEYPMQNKIDQNKIDQIKKSFIYDTTIEFQEDVGHVIETYECELSEHKLRKFLESIAFYGTATCVKSISAQVDATHNSYLYLKEGYPLHFNHVGNGTAKITVSLKPLGCICGIENCPQRIIDGRCLSNRIEKTFGAHIFNNEHVKGR